MSTENLKYLNVKQALADVAHFILTIKAENAELANSKVLLAGGSYSATMVVWFKRLYPDLVMDTSYNGNISKSTMDCS